jgi:hypothetical protein
MNYLVIFNTEDIKWWKLFIGIGFNDSKKNKKVLSKKHKNVILTEGKNLQFVL